MLLEVLQVTKESWDSAYVQSVGKKKTAWSGVSGAKMMAYWQRW